MPNKLTDNDIKKGLEICIKEEFVGAVPNAVRDVIKTALDLINRLEAENERLKEENQEQDQAILNTLRKVRKIRLDAYKEFADRLKANTRWLFSTVSLNNEIDNLLKELIGE